MSRLHDGTDDLVAMARRILTEAARHKRTIATAESCTGGLLSSLLTDLEGLGACFERGFITYTPDAKSDLLGLEPVELSRHGAVSAETAKAMAVGALARSDADIALAITGFAGPAGEHDEEGLVHLACASKSAPVILRECHFGPLGRDRIRHLAVHGALEMLDRAISA